MKPQWLVGAAAVLVVIAVVLGIRLAQRPVPTSFVAGGARPGSMPIAGGASSGASVQAAGADDALCAAHEGAADNPSGSAADKKPAEDPFLTAARQRLLISQNPENLMSVALMAVDNAPQRMEATHRAMSTGSQNATVVWAAVQICDRPGENPTCPAQEWEDELQKLDSENSEVWIHLAASAYKRGDNVKALDAARRASTAAETHEYFPETVAMLERALDSAGGYSFPQRVTLAFSFAAANLPAYESYVSMCSKQSKVDAEWAQTCLDYGRLVERRGTTEIGIGIAQSIQFAALEAMGDTGAAEAVEARKTDGRREFMGAATDAHSDFFLFATPRLFADYLAAMREHGERAAFAQARVEANRLADLCSQQRMN